MEMPEKTLIASLKQGKEYAYRILFDNYYPLLFRIANQYTHDEFIAEDLVEELFFNIWEKHNDLNIETSLKAYLIRAVRNRCLNYLASSKKEINFSGCNKNQTLAIENIFHSEEYPLYQLIEQETENNIANAINGLPDECRKVFLLSRKDDLKYEEIASQLDISVNTVKYHMKNALSILRETLKEYFIYLLFLLLPLSLHA